MSEAVSQTNTKPESSSSSPPPKQNGRGRGRGGRGGRGRSRGGGGGRHNRKSPKPGRNGGEDGAPTDKTTNEPSGESNNGTHHKPASTEKTNNKKQHPNAGRGKSKGGRGGGRGGRGRGRGGRGRGRTNAESENDPANNGIGHTDNIAVEDADGKATDITEPTDVLERPTAEPTFTDPEPVAVGVIGSDTLNHSPDPAAEASNGHSQTATDAAPSTVDADMPDASPAAVAQTSPLKKSRKKGVPTILSRGTQLPEQAAATEATTPETDASPAKAKKKSKKSKKKSKAPVEEEKPAPEPVSATQALTSLPAQEVSITASTQVTMRKEDSINVEDAAAAETKKSKSGKKSKTKRTHDAKGAKSFNNAVRACVDKGDPDTMRALLRDKHNHQYALDAVVLETVMKAYVMAAMLDDALYCLRNCCLPGTLTTSQTERILTCLPQNLRNSSAFTAADVLDALGVATAFDTPSHRTYFLRIGRGIALEFLEEATSARDRICTAPCERLVRSALCVVNAMLERGKKPTELVVKPGDQLGVFVPDSMENRGIQAGDAVSILPYAGPYPISAESLDRNMIEATVTNTNPMVLRLQDKTNAKLYAMLTEKVQGNVYRIDKLANRMGFNRQLAAAVAMTTPADSREVVKRPSPELIQAVTAMDENINRVMMKANNGTGSSFELTSTAALCSQAIPWSAVDEGNEADEESLRSTCRLALEKYRALEGLNGSQRMAVEGATSNRLTLVQGPPGTGKTMVAIRILQHWARLAMACCGIGETPQPILATSDSNIAVDNLVEGCAAVGLRVVRLGRPEAIRPELLRYCVDRPPSSYDGRGGNNSSPAINYKDRGKQIKNAQIICCTCIGSGGEVLDGMTFEHILVDEATQATEPAVLVPLMRGCRQLVLVGDHCQLPPTVLSTRAEEEGHGVPLFSRMVACGVPPFMLDTQYRMHPCIAMFPSDLFYGGLLKNGVSAPERRPLPGFPWPREEFPVAFIPVQGIEMDDGVSKYNEAEAEAACDAVTALLHGGGCHISDIAVVTPYAAQARLIRRLTRRLVPSDGPPFIEVSSVDGFQGREKEAVVFSAVRSNDYGAIGFTSDWRRVNVSFTRARRALIVIGNDQTLRRGDPDTWMPWLAWADAHGINMDKPGIPRGRYEPEQLRRVRGGTTAAEMLKDVLARQQAQMKDAERRQEFAEKNTKGHIMGTGSLDGEDENPDSSHGLSLEEDLAQLANTDGNWDDSDDDEQVDLRRNVSRATLTSASSYGDVKNSSGGDDEAVDIWDL